MDTRARPEHGALDEPRRGSRWVRASEAVARARGRALGAGSVAFCGSGLGVWVSMSLTCGPAVRYDALSGLTCWWRGVRSGRQAAGTACGHCCAASWKGGHRFRGA